jgi:hypothetical protein
MCLDFRRYENLFPKKKKKKFKMVLCQRLQIFVLFNARNGMCAYPHKNVLCQGCRQNHSFIIEKTCEILASELPSKMEGGKKASSTVLSKGLGSCPIKRVKKQVGSGPSQPLAKPSQNLPET